MVVLPLSKAPGETMAAARFPKVEQDDLLRVGSAATLLAGGALLLTGNRRLGLVAAAAGTTMAMLDQKETLKKWWELLPDYLVGVQRVLTQVEQTVDEFAVQRERLVRAMGRREEVKSATAAAQPR